MSLTGTLRGRHPRVTAEGAEAPRDERGGDPARLVRSHSPAVGRPDLPHLEAVVTDAGLLEAGGWEPPATVTRVNAAPPASVSRPGAHLSTKTRPSQRVGLQLARRGPRGSAEFSQGDSRTLEATSFEKPL